MFKLTHRFQVSSEIMVMQLFAIEAVARLQRGA
jgi:hypothetical protein